MAEMFSEEWFLENRKMIEKLSAELDAYLAEDKVFVPMPERYADVQRAYAIAKSRFEDVEIHQCPLHSGSLHIHITEYAIDATGSDEIAAFCKMISLSDNFELYASNDDGKIIMSLTFCGALRRI